jgi:2-amino-4-hydroxy-6-hydroxymethyldihydropteridine diphosphokinase
MILIALGSNIAGPWGTPRQAVEHAVGALNEGPVRLVKCSTLIETAPFGNINQPNFVNAVAQVDTALSPESLLRRLHMIERFAGRKRRRRWGPRTLDLDIIDYKGFVKTLSRHALNELVLPHPGIAVRNFVLRPIMEVAPNWRHPVTRKSAMVMIHKP